MRRTFTLIAVLLLATPDALAASDRQLQLAIRVYQEGNAAQARKTLRTVLKRKSLSSADRIEAHFYLAEAELLLGSDAAALVELKKVAFLDSDAAPDEAEFVPDLIRLWKKAKSEDAPAGRQTATPTPVKSPSPAVVSDAPVVAPVPTPSVAETLPTIERSVLPAPTPRTGFARPEVSFPVIGGGVALAGGGALFVMALGEKRGLDDPEGQIANLDQVRERISRGRLYETGAYVLGGAGALSLGFGLVMAMSGPRAPVATIVPLDGGAAVQVGGTL